MSFDQGCSERQIADESIKKCEDVNGKLDDMLERFAEYEQRFSLSAPTNYACVVALLYSQMSYYPHYFPSASQLQSFV